MGQVLIFTFFLIGFGLVSTYQVGNDPFTREEPLDPEGKYLLQWHIDWNSKRITFKTTVETKGWVGFGISNNGTVEAGADFVIGGVRDNGKTYFSVRNKNIKNIFKKTGIWYKFIIKFPLKRIDTSQSEPRARPGTGVRIGLWNPDMKPGPTPSSPSLAHLTPATSRTSSWP